jgi:hypothetical protein
MSKAHAAPMRIMATAIRNFGAIMNICDNSLLSGEAFLNSADKAAIRHHDAHISAQCSLTLAKLEWAREAVVGETWMQRCARIIPKVSQRKIDDVVVGRFPKIAQDTGELSPAEYEDRLKALAEAHGLPYRTPEEREAYGKELVEAMAAKRQATMVSARAVQLAQRNGCDEPKTETNAEDIQERRNTAEAIRVANGGAPAQQRTYSAPAVPATPAYDEKRDDLLLTISNKMRYLTRDDLNEVNDLIDALTYPLRQQL